MADAAGAPGQIGREFRVARRHQSPAVNEDLRADLLGDYLAVELDRAAQGRFNPLLQAQISRVLGGVAHAAPPEHGLLFDQIIQPGLADLRRRNLRVVAVIFQGADEGECAGDVVIGDDQRHSQAIMHVVVDLAQALADGFVGPAFKGAAQVHADDLTQDAGVYAFQIVAWQTHQTLSSIH